MVSGFFWIFFMFVPGTHFYRKQTKYTTPAANPVRTTTIKEKSFFFSPFFLIDHSLCTAQSEKMRLEMVIPGKQPEILDGHLIRTLFEQLI